MMATSLKRSSMEKRKRVVKNIARSSGLEGDDLLLALWYHPRSRFEYLKNADSLVKNDDVVCARNIARQRKGGGRSTRGVDAETVGVRLKKFKDIDFSIGKPMTDQGLYVTSTEVLLIHDELVKDFASASDPISPSGLKDEDLLEAALFHPKTSYEGNLKYPTIESSGAALLYALSHNHCFHNGNKRTSLVALLVYLDKHNTTLTCSEDEMFKISLKLADHKLMEPEFSYPDAEIHGIAKWIHGNCRAVVKGERAISFMKLKQILRRFDCTIEGDRVIRKFPSSFFRKNIEIRLPEVRDGDEVDKGLIKKIRQELRLTPDDGIDTKTFYSAEPIPAREFIDKYKNLLKRLSRF